MRVVDKGEILQIKVPCPLPLAWGRTVAPYAPPGSSKAPKPVAVDDKADDGNEPLLEAAGRFLQVAGIGGTSLASKLQQSFQVLALVRCLQLNIRHSKLLGGCTSCYQLYHPGIRIQSIVG